MNSGIEYAIWKFRNIVWKSKCMVKSWYWYEKARMEQRQMPASILEQEYRKYKTCQCLYDSFRHVLLIQWKTFCNSRFTLLADNLKGTVDNDGSTVFVVVRNEIERMKVFLEHYRKLGVERFVVLDNGSDDGTVELLMQQKDTKVYQVTDAFETHKKEGWIEKLLALEGQNRWCVVVDSDELLDYVGSEEHSLKELIQTAQRQGYQRIGGVMLDMYAKDSLFSHESSFTETLRYFDKDGYTIADKEDSWEICDTTIYGGPRDRVFGGSRALSKQSIFYFGEGSLYIHCHFMYPFLKMVEVPCWYVLRHYKYLESDRKEYARRAQEKNFYNGSIEYQTVGRLNGSMSFYYKQSQEYTGSESMRSLPFLKEIPW